MKRFSTVQILVFLIVAGASGLVGQSVELISKADPVPELIGQSSNPALSADGRWIAFVGTAPNLVPGQVDENLSRNHADTFLHDQVTGTTVLVSHAVGSPSRAARQPERSDDFQTGPQISADGRYVAFLSSGIDLIPGISDANNSVDVFLYDRVTGTTTLISHAAGSPTTTADGVSYGVRISADGNYVAFASQAKNLVAGQSDSDRQHPASGDDVFLWSRASGTVLLLSRRAGTTSVTGNRDSRVASISADGNVIVFTSEASDLLPAVSDPTGNTDVFVYQRSSNDISLISRVNGSPLTAGGAGFINDLTEPVISADGRYVAFVSWADDLVPGQVDPFFTVDAFLYDRGSGVMRLVSHTSASPQTAGGMPEFYAGSLAINADGRYVAFVSKSSILVPGQVDTNKAEDIFIYDRVTGTTELATHTPGSPTTTVADTNGFAWPNLSADGRFLSYQSLSDELSIDTTDTFLYDRSSRKTTLLSRARGSVSTPANDFSSFPSISADGSVVAFNSQATNLDGPHAEPNTFWGLFLYHRTSDEITSPARHAPALPSLAPNGPSVASGISADGRFILFLSRATGFVPGQVDAPDEGSAGTWDIFLRDRVAGTTVLVSRSASSRIMATGGRTPVLSANGQFVAFIRAQSPFGDPTTGQLLLYDRTTAALTLATHASGSATEPDAGRARGPSISADGRHLAYSCEGCSLVPGYSRTDGGSDIFLYDRVTGTHTLVSQANGSTSQGGDGSSENPLISADGRFVVFSSSSTNLVAGQAGEHGRNVFVFDRTTGAIALVSRTPASPVTAAGGSLAGLSGNGRFIAFYSSAPNLVPGQVDPNPGTDLFLHDRVSGTTVLVSHAASSPVTAGNVEYPFFSPVSMISISDDGRFLVYESTATDLVAGVADTRDSLDLFLYNRLSSTNTLISRAPDIGFPQNQYPQNPRISADGSRITFLRRASGLTVRYDLYIYDLGTGKTDLIGPADLIENYGSQISADGRRIAFTTYSPLVSGDFNGVADVYLWSDGFVTLPNCKLLDTRRRADRPVLTSNVQRTVAVRGACGVPATAKQVLVNVTVVNPSGKGNLRFYPGAVTATPSGILRFERGVTRTETFTLPLGTNGTLTVLPFVASRGTVHVAVEVTGYSQ